MSVSEKNLPKELINISSLVAEINDWQAHRKSTNRNANRYRSAIGALDAALRTTIRYVRKRDDGAERDRDHEYTIHELWQEASVAVAPIDKKLARACVMKGLGWSDPNKWRNAYKNDINVSISNMEEALMNLTDGYGDASNINEVPKWFPVV